MLNLDKYIGANGLLSEHGHGRGHPNSMMLEGMVFLLDVFTIDKSDLLKSKRYFFQLTFDFKSIYFQLFWIDKGKVYWRYGNKKNMIPLICASTFLLLDPSIVSKTILIPLIKRYGRLYFDQEIAGPMMWGSLIRACDLWFLYPLLLISDAILAIFALFFSNTECLLIQGLNKFRTPFISLGVYFYKFRLSKSGFGNPGDKIMAPLIKKYLS